MSDNGHTEMFRLIHGSAHDLPLPDESVHMIATSPPYFGLRAYAGDQEVAWPEVTYCPMAGLPPVTVPGWTGALGMEPTVEAYIGHLVLCLREWRRVLRKDGTVWVNLGDSYARSPQKGQKFAGGLLISSDKNGARAGITGDIPNGLKEKDLIGVPWRLAFAAQADGWWLRSDIVWSKGNSMPESVRDRPTMSHEYIFLLARSPRYYYDTDAIREEPSEVSLARIRQPNFANQTGGPKDYREGINPNRSMRRTLENFAKNPGRNKRSVWMVNTEPTPYSHFAVWPRKLVEIMILAGTSARGVCPTCGAPYERVVERVAHAYNAKEGAAQVARTGGAIAGGTERVTLGVTDQVERTTVGWRPMCKCTQPEPPEPVPATVLDPFSGSGTTGKVAVALGRRYIGVDISDVYLDEITPKRLGDGQIGLPLGL